MAITVAFAELDSAGGFTHCIAVAGKLLGYEAGYALVQYRTADLPARFQDGTETQIIRHECAG